MKHVLIVHAHPEPQSFTSSMRFEATREFEAAGCEVRVSDLYAKHFNPVASADDFSFRTRPDYLVYALEQRHAHEQHSLAPDIAEEVENVVWADLVVFNFPVFWFSVPAIMKGWIDRVLLSGLFYGGLRFYDRGGLVGKTAWVTLTLGGRPHMFGPHGIHGELQGMLSHLLRGTLGYVGFRVLKPFVGFHVPYISQEERRRVMQDLREAVRHVDTRDALSFPSLDHFDEKLYPLGIITDA
ncbi:NAD(P)H-dependent oxidoreductase [Paraburkholderia sp. ZP32-5]|uniref:NAD(P)H-dependent oxidoreductase n=1 Tax=Paraburkholderia sp. ZP32-5 TaxID=2883245 RepID=UPI001F45D8D0|nr:NAD(P)H-dependent oxidoreductase [Paraburkholderia sp. ZP32-5]